MIISSHVDEANSEAHGSGSVMVAVSAPDLFEDRITQGQGVLKRQSMPVAQHCTAGRNRLDTAVGIAGEIVEGIVDHTRLSGRRWGCESRLASYWDWVHRCSSPVRNILAVVYRKTPRVLPVHRVSNRLTA